MGKNQTIAKGVSLIVTTYNRPLFLELVLKSILRQKVMPAEVIIADDGSTIETEELINRYVKLFPVPLIHSWIPDKGFRLAKSRNMAIARFYRRLHHHHRWRHSAIALFCSRSLAGPQAWILHQWGPRAVVGGSHAEEMPNIGRQVFYLHLRTETSSHYGAPAMAPQDGQRPDRHKENTRMQHVFLAKRPCGGEWL